jgi:hypothetical protein
VNLRKDHYRVLQYTLVNSPCETIHRKTVYTMYQYDRTAGARATVTGRERAPSTEMRSRGDVRAVLRRTLFDPRLVVALSYQKRFVVTKLSHTASWGTCAVVFP